MAIGQQMGISFEEAKKQMDRLMPLSSASSATGADMIKQKSTALSTKPVEDIQSTPKKPAQAAARQTQVAVARKATFKEAEAGICKV